MINIIIIALLPVLGALMDGFQHEGKKLLGSFFKSAFLGVICYFLILDLTLWHVLYLLLCWQVLFDPVYNKVRGEGMFYVGNTKWTDRFLRWICDKLPIFNKFAKGQYSHISFITKLIALATAIGLIFIKL